MIILLLLNDRNKSIIDKSDIDYQVSKQKVSFIYLITVSMYTNTKQK